MDTPKSDKKDVILPKFLENLKDFEEYYKNSANYDFDDEYDCDLDDPY